MDIKRNSSTDCYSFMNNSYELIINLSVYGATTSIGAVSALTAIVLILVAKGYKEFVYRLILYMALDFVLGYPFMLTWDYKGTGDGRGTSHTTGGRRKGGKGVQGVQAHAPACTPCTACTL